MTDAKSMKLQFLGTSTAIPDIGSDTASAVINDRYLIDTGWSAVPNLRRFGLNPTNIDHVFFTHMHHDHFLGFPGFLFYWLMRSNRDISELKIIGPPDDVERVVDLSLEILRLEKHFMEKSAPTVVPLRPGESYETEDLMITTCSSKHAVPGLCYRFTDKSSKKSIVMAGDSAYHPPISELAKDCNILVHEASMGPVEQHGKDNPYLHSGAIDAGKIAQAARAQQLYMVHGPHPQAEECVVAAKTVFDQYTGWPQDGQIIII